MNKWRQRLRKMGVNYGRAGVDEHCPAATVDQGRAENGDWTIHGVPPSTKLRTGMSSQLSLMASRRGQ